MNSQYLILGGTALASAALGSGVTYLVLNKRLEAKYEEIAREDLKDAKAYYKILYKKGEEYASPVDLAESLDVKVQELGYAPSDDEIVTVNEQEPLGQYEPEGDWDAEVRKRTSDKPYIVTQQEHLESELTQITLTYFEEDDVLVDEGETPIEKVDETVGEINLTRFGHVSKDNNVVYVRNERLEVDFEIVRNKGSFAKDVLGFIEHSENLGRPRKFRRDYE
jgi:hypothetical protein